jgi:hypothetical protein
MPKKNNKAILFQIYMLSMDQLTTPIPICRYTIVLELSMNEKCVKLTKNIPILDLIHSLSKFALLEGDVGEKQLVVKIGWLKSATLRSVDQNLEGEKQK